MRGLGMMFLLAVSVTDAADAQLVPLNASFSTSDAFQKMSGHSLDQQDSTSTPLAVEISKDRPLGFALGFPAVEPYVAVDPRNPLRLLGGAMIHRPDGTYGIVSFNSTDGGKTWSHQDLGIKDGADVVTLFLDDGTAILAALGDDDSDLRVFRSGDGGRRWSPPTIVAKGLDRPTLMIDRSKAPNTVYVAATGSALGLLRKSRHSVFVARSVDRGATFNGTAKIILSNLASDAHDSVALPDGSLAVLVADYRRSASRRRLERQRDWLVLSKDGGEKFSEPLLVAETCAGAGGWSKLAVDSSNGPKRGRLYHACTAANFDGMFVRYSDDQGETWSTPVRVDRPVEVTPYARTPAIAVDANGVVAAAWYDGRGDNGIIKGSLRCHEVYFAASLDNGVTFEPEVKVSSKRSCPGTPENVMTALRFPAGGEYFGLASPTPGTFLMIWSDARDGKYELRTAEAKVTSRK